jgi:HK97 family phage prohead protease
MITKTAPLKVKAGPEDGLADGEFLVYPSTFTKTPDSYGDVVAPGAFLDTIEEWEASGHTLPGLYGHRFDDPDFYVASALEMGEDEHGWWVKGVFDLESPKGAQVYRLVKGRRLTQLSFAFDVLDEGLVELDDGVKANELRRLKVYEFSFVPIGANQDTSVVAVKAAVDTFAHAAKAGRVFSAKNEDELRAVLTSIDGARDGVLKLLSELDPDGDGGEGTESDASDGPAKDEEPSGAKSEEPIRSSVELLKYRLISTEGAI